MSEHIADCARCDGNGMVEDDAGAFYQCPACGGTGKARGLPAKPQPDRTEAIGRMAEAADRVLDGFNPRAHARTTDPDTSAAAALSVQDSSVILKARIYHVFTQNPEGLTAEEAAEKLGLPYAQVWKRVSDLKNEGRIEDAGKTRPNTSGRQAVVLRTPVAGGRQETLY